jgi:hypothetical protein
MLHDETGFCFAQEWSRKVDRALRARCYFTAALQRIFLASSDEALDPPLSA